LKKNVKTRKIANILETTGNIAKSSKFQPKTLRLGVLKGMIVDFEFYRKKMFQIGCYFSGSKNEFRQQVWGLRVFPITAILQS